MAAGPAPPAPPPAGWSPPPGPPAPPVPRTATDPTDVLGRRIGAALLDIVVLFILIFVVGLIFGKSQASGSNVSVNLTGVGALVYFVLVAFYYFIPEAASGQTLGKRVLGIRVRRADGRPATAGPAAVRTVLRVIDGLPVFYLVGLIAILITRGRHQRLGDMAAGTVVTRS